MWVLRKLQLNFPSNYQGSKAIIDWIKFLSKEYRIPLGASRCEGSVFWPWNSFAWVWDRINHSHIIGYSWTSYASHQGWSRQRKHSSYASHPKGAQNPEVRVEAIRCQWGWRGWCWRDSNKEGQSQEGRHHSAPAQGELLLTQQIWLGASALTCDQTSSKPMVSCIGLHPSQGFH